MKICILLIRLCLCTRLKECRSKAWTIWYGRQVPVFCFLIMVLGLVKRYWFATDTWQQLPKQQKAKLEICQFHISRLWTAQAYMQSKVWMDKWCNWAFGTPDCFSLVVIPGEIPSRLKLSTFTHTSVQKMQRCSNLCAVHWLKVEIVCVALFSSYACWVSSHSVVIENCWINTEKMILVTSIGDLTKKNCFWPPRS